MDKSWLLRISEDDDADELEESSTSIQLIRGDSRKFLWWMCNMYKANHSGIPGQACQIFERALLALIKNNAAIIQGQGADLRNWRQWKRDQESRLPLLVSVCVWLAVKMSTAVMFLSTSIICQKLMQHGFVYTRQAVIDTEMQVYYCLNFRIPIWTTVDKALLLAREVGLSQCYVDEISTMVNFAEFRRHRIQKTVVRVAGNSTPSASTGPRPELRNIRNSHFCAGAVVAMIHTLGRKLPDLVTKLAQLTKSTDLYINCIVDAIVVELHKFKHEFREDPPSLRMSCPESHVIKRKNEPDDDSNESMTEEKLETEEAKRVRYVE